MSSIIKTEAVVIKKLNHGDSSKIITIYSVNYGKMSVIAKGIKSPKSKLNARLELFNIVETVIYNKESREIQLISSAEIVKAHNTLVENLDYYQYAMAVLELYNSLLHDHEKNERLYNGLTRILSLLNSKGNKTQELFLRFFLFFTTEIGYGLQIDKCAHCGKFLMNSNGVFYSYTEGIMCNECAEGHLINFEFSKELFNLIICLSSKNNLCNYTKQDLDFLAMFLERHIAYHNDNFRGLKSLKIF